MATASILIAAIRDYLYQGNPSERLAADKYTQQYLLEFDENNGEHAPKLRLNNEDSDFFTKHLLLPPDHTDRQTILPTTASHKLLQIAASIAKEHVRLITEPLPKTARAKHLYSWIKFLHESAVVIAIRVPDLINAYTMFETLNDRGLRASQADIMKNFLFGIAQDRLKEVAPRWAAMKVAIEAIGDDDLLIKYLRHYWIAYNGPVTAKDLAKNVKQVVLGRQHAVNLATALQSHATDYAAILSPLDHSRLQRLDIKSRGYICSKD